MGSVRSGLDWGGDDEGKEEGDDGAGDHAEADHPDDNLGRPLDVVLQGIVLALRPGKTKRYVREG